MDIKNEIFNPQNIWKSEKDVNRNTLIRKSNYSKHFNEMNKNDKINRVHSYSPKANKNPSKRTSFFPFREADSHLPQNHFESHLPVDDSDTSLLDYSVNTNELNSFTEETLGEMMQNTNHPFKDISDGGISSLDGKEIYYVGIIDILIKFNSLKKIEFVSKLFYNCSSKMSVVPPQKYRDRFVDYISTIFIKDY